MSIRKMVEELEQQLGEVPQITSEQLKLLKRISSMSQEEFCKLIFRQ